MKNQYIIITVLIALISCFITSCRKPHPSVAKIFVRNSFKELLIGVDVMIVAEADSVPALDAVAKTNSSGYASFNLDDYFAQFSVESTKAADFKIYLDKDGNLVNVGDFRARANTTAVQTVFFDLE